MGLSSKHNDDRATPATFMNVTEMRDYVPSWLAPKCGDSGDQNGLAAERLSQSASASILGGPASNPGRGKEIVSRVSQQPIPVTEVDEPEGAFSTPDLDAIQQEYRALEEERRETSRLNEEFATAISKIVRSREEMLGEATRQVVELAMLAASRVITREARLDPGILENLVREALRALAEREPTKVRVGRGFAAAVDSATASLALEAIRVEIGVDPELEEFGCIVQTDIACVDESLDQRFSALVDALEAGRAQ